MTGPQHGSESGEAGTRGGSQKPGGRSGTSGTSGTSGRSGRSGRSGIRWGRAYQGTLEAVLAIVIMAVLGAWADSHFETGPVLLLVGLAIGFGSFVLRLLRLLRELEQPGEDGEAPGDRPGRAGGKTRR